MFYCNTAKVIWDDVIGKGPCSTVYAYRKNEKDDRWVVRVTNVKNSDDALRISNEITLGFSCEHPNILPIKGYYIQKRTPAGFGVYVKLPKMQTNLAAILSQHKKNNYAISEKDIIKYFYSIACGLDYLHTKRISHRNLKPENIMISKHENVKISDIGSGFFWASDDSSYDQQSEGFTYFAPEAQFDRKALKKESLYSADLWSLGAVMFELCSFTRIRLDEDQEAIRKEVVKLTTNYNKVLVNLIMGLLCFDPKERTSAKEIKKILESAYQYLTHGKKKENSDRLPEIESKRSATMQPPSPEVIEELQLRKKSMDQPEQSRKGDEKVKLFGSKSISFNFSYFNVDKEKKYSKKNDKINKDFVMSTMNGLKLYHKEVQEKWQIRLKLDEKYRLIFIRTKELEVNDADVGQITKDIQKVIREHSVKELRYLSLNLERCIHITDKGIKELSMFIKRDFPQLQDLYVYLGSCENITDLGLKDLSKQLGTGLKEIQSLHLSLGGCVKITDDGVKSIPLNLKGSTHNLTYLHFDFWSCRLLTDQSLLELSNFIKSECKKLQHLHFYLGSCRGITDNGVDRLASIVRNKPSSLQNFQFNFGGCRQITDDGVKKMVAAFKKKQKGLERPLINFFGCEKTTRDTKVLLAELVGLFNTQKNPSSGDSLKKRFFI